MLPIVRKLAVLTLVASGMGLLGLGALASEQRRILYPGTGGAAAVWSRLPEGYQQVQLTTSDGLQLKALYQPASASKRTLLFLHGNGDTVTGSAQMVAPLVDAGYGALLVEYRGYAGNPGSPTEQGLYRDGFAARDFLYRAGIADDQIVLAGYSLGSGIAGRLAADRTPAAMILIAGFTSVPDAAAQHFGSLPARMLLDQYPTIDRIGRIKAPILLIHGADDRTVFPENSIALKRAAPGATLAMVPDQSHVIAYDPIAARLMLDWLRQHRL